MQRGFSLIEIMVTIAILIMLAASVAAVSFSYLRNQQVRSASDAIVAELLLAQTNAYAQTHDAGHGIMVFTDRVIRFEGDTYASRVEAEDVTTLFSTIVALSGISEVNFLNGSLSPVVSGTITLESNETAMDITISPYGVVQTTARAI